MTQMEKSKLGSNRSPIVPCLWFDDQATAAADFYTSTFPGGRVTAVSHYPESSDNPSGKPRGSVLTVEFEVAGQHFTALNGGPQFTINPSLSFFAYVDTVDEAERLFAQLSSGGRVLMEIAEYPWSPRYGWTQDRFGVSWQVIAGRRPPGAPAIAPCLMFNGRQHGKAESALQNYARIFRNARVDAIERYARGEGPASAEGTVKHGRIAVGDQTLIAMDSHVEHGFTFNEAVSLQIMCDDQTEIDQYWAALSDGGEQGPCGWLKDPYGVSWQVVPSSIAQFLTSKDTAARDRAFKAVMKMGKLDIAAIQSAFAGTSA
jgi:predicted 3-demethylubiquinone-9 3-methyltransferase (glyoxalase superfamily)